MSGHTPGPWHCDNEAIFAEEGVLARIPNHPENGRNWPADARLIAAAPDLLEALQNIIGAFDAGQLQMSSPEIGEPENNIPMHQWHDEWLHYARAALTRAKEQT